MVAGLDPNSNIAAFCGGVGTPLRFILTSAPVPGLETVKFAFRSAGLKVVSSWSIIGAGSEGGVVVATGARGGVGMALFAPPIALVGTIVAAGCFAQPMSETVVGLLREIEG